MSPGFINPGGKCPNGLLSPCHGRRTTAPRRMRMNTMFVPWYYDSLFCENNIVTKALSELLDPLINIRNDANQNLLPRARNWMLSQPTPPDSTRCKDHPGLGADISTSPGLVSPHCAWDLRESNPCSRRASQAAEPLGKQVPYSWTKTNIYMNFAWSGKKQLKMLTESIMNGLVQIDIYSNRLLFLDTPSDRVDRTVLDLGRKILSIS